MPTPQSWYDAANRILLRERMRETTMICETCRRHIWPWQHYGLRGTRRWHRGSCAPADICGVHQ